MCKKLKIALKISKGSDRQILSYNLQELKKNVFEKKDLQFFTCLQKHITGESNRAISLPILLPQFTKSSCCTFRKIKKMPKKAL